MKSMKAKAKSRKTNGRFGRVKFPTKEASPDLSQLYQPIDTSVSTLYHVTKLLENGTDEVRSILAHECDLVYECRICRSLFRSLANFISHKRVYCREKFDVTFVRKSSDDYDTIFTRESNVQAAQKVCLESNVEPPEKVGQESNGNDRILRSQVSREKQKKDLCAVVDMLQRKQVETLQVGKGQLFLEAMESNPSAVYQTSEAVDSMDHELDLMKTQILELEEMLNKQSILISCDGHQVELDQLRKANTSKDVSVQVHSDEDSVDTLPDKRFTCSTCNATFSTKKTLAVHTRALHAPQRTCYPCPCCSSTFANSWSVYRHLFKVHRKSNEQVRKLRSQVQVKAFLKESSMTEDVERERERSNKSTESNSLHVNDTQEWMNHLETDTQFQRCGGCGKRFDRKAALFAHSQYCQVRVAARKASRKPKRTKKATFTENSASSTEVSKEQLDTVDSSASSEVSSDTNEMSIRVEAVSSLSKADWDMMDSVEPVLCPGTETNDEIEETTRSSPASELSDVPEIIFTSINKSKATGRNKRKRKLTVKRVDIHTEEKEDGSISREPNDSRLDPALLMERKMCSIADLPMLQCLPCKRKFTSVTNLRRHLAIHIGWYRYRCKLCTFKCFVKCDSVAHCNKVHNAQNNRTLIEDMVEQIPEKEYACDEEILLDITRIEENIRTPEVVEICASPDSDSASLSEEGEGTREAVAVRDERGKTEATGKNGANDLNAPVDVPSKDNAPDSGTPVLAAGLDPDLRRMVMEVIFGSSDASYETKDSESKETEVPSVLEYCPKNTNKPSNTGASEDPESDLKKNMQQNKRIGSEKLDSESKIESSSDSDTTSEKSESVSRNKPYSRMAFEKFVLENHPQHEANQDDKRTERLGFASKHHDAISERLEGDLKDTTTHNRGRTTPEVLELKDNEPTQDTSKPQRPTRNRIKPLNKDFVYDLKEVPFLKDSLVVKPFSKLAKKSPVQDEEDTDRDREQPSKRFKSLSDKEDVIICENPVTDKFDVRLSGESLKNSFAFSQCRS